MIKKSQLQFLGGEANFPKRFTLDTDCKGFQNDLFCSKQKYRSLEATVTKSQQVITLLRICVVLVYFSYISCFISLQPWEWKSAAYEIAVPDACTKYFDICVSIEKVDCFPKTLETSFSRKRDHQEKYAWCRATISCLLWMLRVMYWI